ncbi:hypothetical protein Ga0609869_002056 [Rhodovulum iodosum]|uniref:Uncharacterized protein n=1 Tax=Rhodovulum iodosum TaxID=68291 RepID=A0ABV3XTP9_9RHOB|nr:hypothetical protein [Rhodovulum robiginosum]
MNELILGVSGEAHFHTSSGSAAPMANIPTRDSTGGAAEGGHRRHQGLTLLVRDVRSGR